MTCACVQTIQDFNLTYNDNWFDDLTNYWYPDKPSLMMIFTEFGICVGNTYNRLLKKDLELIFESIEKVMNCTNEDCSNAAATGFLEAMINFTDRGQIEINEFWSLLGEKSRNYLIAWNDFCGVESPVVVEKPSNPEAER